MRFLKNIENFYIDDNTEKDSGDIIQTIIIVAAFAVIAITVVGLIGSAVESKGRSAGDCLVGIDTVNPGAPLVDCEPFDPFGP